MSGNPRTSARLPARGPVRAARRAWGAVAGLLLVLAQPEAHGGDPRAELAAPGQEIRVLALSGHTAPDGHGTIAGLRSGPPLLNNRGQVLLIADIHAPDVDIDAQAILLSTRPGELRQLLRTGGTLPGGASFGWVRGGEDTCLNDAGQAAVYVPVDASDRVLNVIYRVAADGRITEVHEPDRVRGLSGSFTLTDAGELMLEAHSMSRPAFNALGQVAFQAPRGIFMAEPDGSIRSVVRVGDPLAGGRVLEIMFAGDEPCRSGFNDAGQVAFYARLAVAGEERDGMFLAEPPRP